MSRKGLKPPTPALAKQQSTFPSASTVPTIASTTASSSPTSAIAANTRRPGRRELGFGRCVLRRVGAPDRDVGAGRGARVRDGQTDPAVAAGDEHHPTRQVTDGHSPTAASTRYNANRIGNPFHEDRPELVRVRVRARRDRRPTRAAPRRRAPRPRRPGRRCGAARFTTLPTKSSPRRRGVPQCPPMRTNVGSSPRCCSVTRA